MIILTPTQIENALPRLLAPIQKYLWIQDNFQKRNVAKDVEFQKKFDGFYGTWHLRPASRSAYFQLLEKSKENGILYRDALSAIHEATGRLEASFVSKLVATIDPTMPVIDSVVLRNLGLRLPTRGSGTDTRIAVVADLHEKIRQELTRFLATEEGKFLDRRFRETFPKVNISEVKMLDLVLWQTR